MNKNKEPISSSVMTITVNPRFISWQGKEGILEASDLGHAFTECALKLTSPRTGVTKVFYYAYEERDSEGDLTCTIYVTKELDNLRLRILND